jgi:hypothetical protein
MGGAIPYTDAITGAPQVVATILIPAGRLNVTGRTLRVRVSGHCVVGGILTCSHTLLLGGMVLANVSPVPVAPTAPGAPWLMDLEFRNNGGLLLSAARILKPWNTPTVTVDSASAIAAPDLSLVQPLELSIQFTGVTAGESGALDLFTADIGG